MSSPVVYLDIAGPDGDTLGDFYSAVFDWELDAARGVTVNVSAPLEGTIREDPAEKRFYLGVSDVDATLDLIEDHGGTIEARRFEVPGVAVLGLFSDPAGNEMGLVEMDGETPRIP